MTWRTFIRAHWPALLAADFFATEVDGPGPTHLLHGVRIELYSRRVHILGSTPHPDDAFVVQAFRSLMSERDVLSAGRVLICDRDPKWSRAMEALLTAQLLRMRSDSSDRSRPNALIASCLSVSGTFATCSESSPRTLTANGMTRASTTTSHTIKPSTGSVAVHVHSSQREPAVISASRIQ